MHIKFSGRIDLRRKHTESLSGLQSLALSSNFTFINYANVEAGRERTGRVEHERGREFRLLRWKQNPPLGLGYAFTSSEFLECLISVHLLFLRLSEDNWPSLL